MERVVFYLFIRSIDFQTFSISCAKFITFFKVWCKICVQFSENYLRSICQIFFFNPKLNPLEKKVKFCKAKTTTSKTTFEFIKNAEKEVLSIFMDRLTSTHICLHNNFDIIKFNLTWTVRNVFEFDAIGFSCWRKYYVVVFLRPIPSRVEPPFVEPPGARIQQRSQKIE